MLSCAFFRKLERLHENCFELHCTMKQNILIPQKKTDSVFTSVIPCISDRLQHQIPVKIS